MSDVQLASQIEPSNNDNEFVKNGLLIVPNPTGYYDHDQNVYIYFEIYNLSQDSKGNTSFTIEYTLTLLDKKRRGLMNLFGLLGGSKSSITLRNDREGNSDFSREYLAIDISNADLGEHDLSVKIKDKFSGESVLRSQKIHLY